MSQHKIYPKDYEKLKKFLGLYVDWFFPKAGKPEDHPLIFIADLEKKSLSNAKRGVKMAINDIVESSLDWSPAQVAKADAKFACHDTFTLSELRRRYSKKYLQVLKREVIHTEAEYYLLKGIADSKGSEIEATQRQQIEAMLTVYESKVTRQST